MGRGFCISELLKFLKDTQIVEIEMPKKDFFITGFSPITDSLENTLSWMKEQQLDWNKIRSKVVICSHKLTLPENTDIFFIPVEKPRFVIMKILQKFVYEPKFTGISDTVKMGKDCYISENVYIGHYSVIGENVEIGAGTVIHGRVSVYDNVKIGNNCTIDSGVVIGADGFGYEKDEEGVLQKIIHIGGVLIEDDVEIGSNTCIDRGTLGDTIIHKNVKIDNLCHIAHNVEIGENTTVIALAMIGGSTKIGKNCWVAPSSALREGLIIGSNALIGLGAVVVKNVDAGDIVAGVPAKSIRKTKE